MSDLSGRLAQAGFAGLADVANEIDHPRRGFKGFPGHRTLGAQRELARTMLTWIVVLSETLAAERRTHVADRERSEQAQNALLARLRVVDEDRTVG